MIEPKRESELERTMLLMRTPRNAPTGTPYGPRMRAEAEEDGRRAELPDRSVLLPGGSAPRCLPCPRPQLARNRGGEFFAG